MSKNAVTTVKPKNIIWEKLKALDKMGLGMHKRKQLAQDAETPITKTLLAKHQKAKIGDIDFKYILKYAHYLELTFEEMETEQRKQRKETH